MLLKWISSWEGGKGSTIGRAGDTIRFPIFIERFVVSSSFGTDVFCLILVLSYD